MVPSIGSSSSSSSQYRSASDRARCMSSMCRMLLGSARRCSRGGPRIPAPSTWSAAPLTNPAGWEQRNATTLPKSSGSPMRPAAPSSFARSVAWRPGQGQVQRDAVGDQVLRGGLRPCPQAGAGDVRVRERRDGLLHAERGDQADPSPAGCPHVRDRGLHQADRGQLVRVDRGEHLRRPPRRGRGPAVDRPRSRPGCRVPPNRSTVAATRRAGASGSVTSAGIARTSPGSSAAVASRLSALRAQMATRAPSRDSARAAPRPSPLDAAVTSATFPANPRSIAAHRTAPGPSRHAGVPWSRCPSAGSFPRVAAFAAVAALVVTLFSAADGREPGPAAPVLRQHPNIGPFQGMGVWVDLYDDAAWADPAAAVAGHGGARRPHAVPRDLELQPAVPVRGQAGRGGVRGRGARRRRADRRVVPARVRRTSGMDATRSKAAIRFRTDAGQRVRRVRAGHRGRRTSPTSSVRTAQAAGSLGRGSGRSPARRTRSAASSRRRAGSSCTRTTGPGSRTRTSRRSTT